MCWTFLAEVMRILTKAEEQQLVDATLAATITKDGIKMKVWNTEYTFTKVREDVSDEDFRSQCVDYIHKAVKGEGKVSSPSKRDGSRCLQELLMWSRKYLPHEQELRVFAKLCDSWSKLNTTWYEIRDIKAYQERQIQLEKLDRQRRQAGEVFGYGRGKSIPSTLGRDILYCLDIMPRAWRNKVNN